MHSTHSLRNIVRSFALILSFLLKGIELNRHQVTNLINAGFPTVSLQQQPQQQQHMITQTTVKGETKMKGHRNNQQQQQQQQQMLQQQMAGTQLMAVAFPGNPQHNVNQQQQQQIHSQVGQQHQLIAAVPTTGHGNTGRNINNYNSNSTVWACPACKSSFKSATELQTHLR